MIVPHRNVWASATESQEEEQHNYDANVPHIFENVQVLSFYYYWKEQ